MAQNIFYTARDTERSKSARVSMTSVSIWGKSRIFNISGSISRNWTTLGILGKNHPPPPPASTPPPQQKKHHTLAVRVVRDVGQPNTAAHCHVDVPAQQVDGRRGHEAAYYECSSVLLRKPKLQHRVLEYSKDPGIKTGKRRTKP